MFSQQAYPTTSISLPYHFVPQHSILSDENLILVGRIDLGETEDVQEGEENIIGRYRAAIICLDKNSKKKWECIFSDYGYRSQISSVQCYNDSTFLVMMLERQTKYADRKITLLLINNKGKRISKTTLCNNVSRVDDENVWTSEKCTKIQHGFMKVFEKDSIIIAYTYRLGGFSSEENLFMNVELYNSKFERTGFSTTKLGEIGNGESINDIYAEPDRILIATDIGKNKLFNASLFETDNKLKVINKKFYFTGNDESNIIVKNLDKGFILGCSVGNREKNYSSGLLFLNNNLDTTGFVQWGKYDQDDIMGIYIFNNSILVAHESAEMMRNSKGENVIFRSGFSIFDLKGNLSKTYEFFKNNEEEKTVGIVPFKNGFYFISRREDGRGTIVRIINSTYKVTKEVEMNFVPQK